MKLDSKYRYAHVAALGLVLSGVILGIASSYWTIAAGYAAVPGGAAGEAFEFLHEYNDAVTRWEGDSSGADSISAANYLARLNGLTFPPVVLIERTEDGNPRATFAYSREYKDGEGVEDTPDGGIVEFTVLFSGGIAAPEITPQLNSEILTNYTTGAVLRATINDFHRAGTFFESDGGTAKLTIFEKSTDSSSSGSWYDTSTPLSFETFKCQYDHNTRTVKTWFLTQLTLLDSGEASSGPFELSEMESEWSIEGAGQEPYDLCVPPLSGVGDMWTLGYEKQSATEDLSEYCDGAARRPESSNLQLDIIVRSYSDPYNTAVTYTDCTEVSFLSP